MNNIVRGYADDPKFERKEAIRLSRLALSIDDSDPDTLALAAITSAFMVGDSESEIEMADRAVALNPNSYTTWHNRGWVYGVAGLPEEAVSSFERAIRVSPVDPLLYLSHDGMGRAFIELRRFDEAIVVGKKTQRQNPSYVGAYSCLASVFAHLGRDAEAREAAARLLQVDPAFTIAARMGRRRQSHVKLMMRAFGKRGCPNETALIAMEQEQPTRVGRRLAAIVAADVAGYSRLMGLDEVGTARTLREHRVVTDALVAKHGRGTACCLSFPRWSMRLNAR